MKTFVIETYEPNSDVDTSTIEDLNEYIANGGVVDQIISVSPNRAIVTAYSRDEVEGDFECCGCCECTSTSGISTCGGLQEEGFTDCMVRPIQVSRTSQELTPKQWSIPITSQVGGEQGASVADAGNQDAASTLKSSPQREKKIVRIEIDKGIPTEDLIDIFSAEVLRELFNQATVGETLTYTVCGPAYKNVIILD